MNVINIILGIAGLPVLLACLYLLGLSLLSSERPAVTPAARRTHRFRVVVPAHDEEAGIGATLQNLERIEYPRNLWEIVVIADNCTDRTAEVARGRGIRVLERRHPEQRGKGFALEFAIEKLRGEPREEWDALVVVDADTVVTPNLLDAFDARLADGHQAVQATYLPLAPSDSRLAVITEIAFTAFHVVRSAARERLGLSAGLRGNGMAFRRELLDAVPHDAYSRTEDLEFGVRLGLSGVRIAFAAEATVYGEMPDRAAAATHQRQRWIGGRTEIARRYVPELLARAVRERSALLADLAFDLLVPPLSVLLVAAVVGLAASAGGALLLGGISTALIVWLGAGIALAAHVLHAARRAGRVVALIRASTALPGYAFEKTMIATRALRSHGGEWIRTARQGETIC
jgi:1,2-diacylglycerol 3-beta-glucosyltransferase